MDCYWFEFMDTELTYARACSPQFDVRGFEGGSCLIEDADLRLDGRPASREQIVVVDPQKAVAQQRFQSLNGRGNLARSRRHNHRAFRKAHVNLVRGIGGALESVTQTINQFLAGQPRHLVAYVRGGLAPCRSR